MSEQAHLWPDGYYRTTPPDPSSQERRLWLEALIAERDRLREALKRFANQDNWDAGDERTDWAIIVWDGDGNPIEIARAALQEVDDE